MKKKTKKTPCSTRSNRAQEPHESQYDPSKETIKTRVSNNLNYWSWWRTTAVVVCFVSVLANRISPSWHHDPYEELLRAWRSSHDDLVVIKDSTHGGVGLFASKDIQKGDIILHVGMDDKITPQLIEDSYPHLRKKIESVLASYAWTKQEAPELQQVLVVLSALLEFKKGTHSKFYPYFQTLPSNVSTVSWYWTPAERACVVPRNIGYPSPEQWQLSLEHFKTVLRTIVERQWVASSLLTLRDLDTTVEWMYLMLRTRGFSTSASSQSGGFVPLFDIPNHVSTKATSPFVMDHGTHFLVATTDVTAGDEIYNSYGDFSSIELLEQYGFLDEDNPTYVAVPSISEDMIQLVAKSKKPNARFQSLCTSGGTLKFFGLIPEEGPVEAKLGHLHQFKYMKSHRPTESMYQCAQYFLRSQDGATIAKYFVKKLEEDALKYELMTRAPQCQQQQQQQGEDDDTAKVVGNNLALIQKGNVLTAKLLREAAGIARQAANGEIDYPGIVY